MGGGGKRDTVGGGGTRNSGDVEERQWARGDTQWGAGVDRIRAGSSPEDPLLSPGTE